MHKNLIILVLAVAVLSTQAFEAHVVAASAGAQVNPQVGKHKTLELVFTASSAPAEPFDTYLLKIEVSDPAGESFSVEGFYDGDGAPPEGLPAVPRAEPSSLPADGSFECFS